MMVHSRVSLGVTCTSLLSLYHIIPCRIQVGLFYDMALNAFKVFIIFQACFLYSMSTSLLCFAVWVSSIFILLCLLFSSIAAGRKLLDANCVGLHCRRHLSNSESKSWAYLYSGHKDTMKRPLTAALCQLAAVAGSSKCKLRTDTINKGYEKQSMHLFYICICMCTSMF